MEAPPEPRAPVGVAQKAAAVPAGAVAGDDGHAAALPAGPGSRRAFPGAMPGRPVRRGPGISTAAARVPTLPAGSSTTRAEVGRNDPCPCGSGKKYKKCHGQGL